MKRIFRILLLFTVGGIFLFSCTNKETNFRSLYKQWDPNATANYYIQFVDASQSFETGVAEDGSFIDISGTISVALLGAPQSSALDVSLVKVAASTTLADSMYSMSAQSLTIPAGQTSASLSITAFADKMPVDEWLDLVLVLDVGDHNAPVGDRSEEHTSELQSH